MVRENEGHVTNDVDMDFDEEHLRLFQYSVEFAPDGVYWLNREAQIYHANAAACRSLGYTREELTKLKLWDIDPIHPKNAWDKTWERARAADPVEERVFETLHRHKNGVVFPVEVSSKHVRVGKSEYHVAFVRNISERKQIEEQLHLTQSAIDRASSACSWIRSDGSFAYVNDRQCQSLGYCKEELLNLNVQDVDPEFKRSDWNQFWEKIEILKILTFDTVHQRMDGSQFPVEITANFLKFNGKSYCCTFERDLTESKRSNELQSSLEAQLNQAQKMESIGRLAGGVAHDFNNMLSVILGYVDILKNRLPSLGDGIGELIQIEKAAFRSSDLTRQLLTFSRQQPVSPVVMNVNDHLREIQKTLGRLIGEDVTTEIVLGEGLWNIQMDPTQVDQIIVNLAVNAKDAMPDGGTLRIESNNIVVDEAYCLEHCEFVPGQYVRITVSDSGCGMDKKILAKIFDPFFTTKEIGKGTGLGLAIVYGIVKQNNGFIYPYSEVGIGTTLKIYLPRFVGDCSELSTEKEAPAVLGHETILVIEDEEMVRTMTASMLKQLGYIVIAAETPFEGLSFLETMGGEIDLLLTDVVMPEMKGPELRERALILCPGLKVICMSGYSEEINVRQNPLNSGLHFIQKPFSMHDLSLKVRAALGS